MSEQIERRKQGFRESYLKPCPNPACKSTNLKDFYVGIRCLDCLMEGPQVNKGNNDSHADYHDHEQAVNLWNNLLREGD